MGKQVIILHGWRNRRVEGHWQRETAAALRIAGHQVYYPQLPNPDEPKFSEWAEVALTELAIAREANRGEEVVVIGHSLGSVTWLKLAEQGMLEEPVSRALLVAPADPAELTTIPDFMVTPTLVDSGKLANSVLLVGSDGDDWVPRGVGETYGKHMNVPSLVIPGANHFSYLDGWGKWAGVINWVNDPTSDLSIR
jgi:predicted alpha/beta hydrolase family esterase